MAVALRAGGTFANSNPTIPSGAVVGDLLLLYAVNTNTSTPSGWTQLATVGTFNGTNPQFTIWYKFAATGDPGSVVTLSASYSFVAAYSGVKSSTAITFTTATSPAATSATAPSMTLPTQGLLISSAAYVNGSFTVPTGWTQGDCSGASDVDAVHTATTPSGWNWSQTSGTQGWSFITLALAGATSPSAPTLTAPSNAAYIDVASGVTLSGTYNSTDTANQNAYALRIKTSGGTYNYWNAGTNALQSTIVWNSDSVAPGGSFSITLPSGAVSDGNVYNWSLASQEAAANLQSPFATDFTFTAQAAPTVIVNGPSGAETTTTSPTVTWTTTPPSGASQTAYQVIVEHGSYGTSPGSGTQDWASGVVSSNAQTATVAATLVNGTTYRVFVQVTETGGQTSTWSYTTFTVSLDQPAAPTVTATAGADPTTGAPVINVTVAGHDNLLSAADASFEGSLGSTAAITNCTVSDSAGASEDGSNALLMASVAAGNMSAGTASGTSGYAVVAGSTYTIRSDYKAAATARQVRTDVSWYNASGTLISTTTGTQVANTTTGWTTSSATVTAPAGAVYARLVYNVLSTAAASEQHYVDQAGIFPGTVTAWSRGGLVGSTTVVVTRSDSLYLRGASASSPAAIPAGTQQVTIADFEATPGVSYTYTAQVSANIGAVITSPVSAASGSATVTSTDWWYFDPTSATTSAINLATVGFQPARVEFSAAHKPIGATYLTVLTDTVSGTDGTITIRTLSAAQWAALKALTGLQKVLAISSPYGDLYYGRLGFMPGGMSSGQGNQVHTGELSPSTATSPVRDVTLQFIAQPRPSV